MCLGALSHLSNLCIGNGQLDIKFCFNFVAYYFVLVVGAFFVIFRKVAVVHSI